METKIIIKTNDREELETILNRHKYKQFYDELYDEVFRKVIKYSEDENVIKYYKLIWKEIHEYQSEL